MSGGYSAFTFDCGRMSGRLANEVVVQSKNKTITVPALWDTGASGSRMSELVATELGLKTYGVTKVMTPSGNSETWTYLITVTLPNGVLTGKIKVFGSKIGEQTVKIPEGDVPVKKPLGMPVGMDMIGMGDFAVSNFNGKTVFTFRYPSTARTDFEQAPNTRTQ